MMKNSRLFEFIFLRTVAAGMLVIHGVARISLGIVDDFGAFLDQTGFPIGTLIAWTITVFEILGGLTLAAGRFVRILSALFCFHLFAGICLVHFKDGWFVVGAGQNGMEYSVLLICVFVFVFLFDHRQKSLAEDKTK